MTKSDLEWIHNDLSIPGGHFPGVELRPESTHDSHLTWGCYIWNDFCWYDQKSTIQTSFQSHIQVFEKMLLANQMYLEVVSIYGVISPRSPIGYWKTSKKTLSTHLILESALRAEKAPASGYRPMLNIGVTMTRTTVSIDLDHA